MIHTQRRLTRKRAVSMPEISMTPLIDMALTLLIIFMISAPMVNNAIKIDLPEGQVREAEQAQDELIIIMNSAGELFLNDSPIGWDQLSSQLSSQMNKRADKTVFIKADTASNYGQVIKLVDQVKGINSVKYVALATKRVASKQPE